VFVGFFWLWLGDHQASSPGGLDLWFPCKFMWQVVVGSIHHYAILGVTYYSPSSYSRVTVSTNHQNNDLDAWGWRVGHDIAPVWWQLESEHLQKEAVALLGAL
jgi:hypothetical protein